MVNTLACEASHCGFEPRPSTQSIDLLKVLWYNIYVSSSYILFFNPSAKTKQTNGKEVVI